MGNGEDLGRKRKNVDKRGLVQYVAADPDNLENRREAQGTQVLSKKYTIRESVSALSCLIRGFCNKYN